MQHENNYGPIETRAVGDPENPSEGTSESWQSDQSRDVTEPHP
jgi:hypothetical protein